MCSSRIVSSLSEYLSMDIVSAHHCDSLFIIIFISIKCTTAPHSPKTNTFQCPNPNSLLIIPNATGNPIIASKYQNSPAGWALRTLGTCACALTVKFHQYCPFLKTRQEDSVELRIMWVCEASYNSATV